MNIATDIDWDIDNDKVCISFKNKEINNESTLTKLMLINDKLR